MSGLSIRNRIEWFLVSLPFGGALIWLAYFMVKTEGNTAGLAAYFFGIMGIFIIRQMLLAPPNVSVATWWYRNCRAFEVTTISGISYYSLLCDVRTWSLYDKDGFLIGWHGQNRDGYPFFKSASEVPGDVRHKGVSWFSRLRSPRLPEVRAEVLDSDNNLIGHTPFQEVR